MGKLINKSKPTVKARNHPHTYMISKPATARREQMQEMGNAFAIKILAT